jgi:sugar transferase (PEP-CTERM/EpsH1 system associated)
LVSSSSITEGAFYQGKLANQVQRWTSQYDMAAAVIFCSSMYQYTRFFTKKPRRVVVDLVDVDSQKWDDYAESASGPKQWLYHRESQRIQNLETTIATESDALVLVSDHEADLFRTRHHGTHPIALSNGVDLDFFHPINTHTIPHSDSLFPRLVFVGVLDYHPNVQGLVWFCENVLPSLRETYPHLSLDIVGRNPNPAVLGLSNIPGVRVVGEVADVRPYIHAADIAIAPLLIARGIQNKVLEALACARPVIASSAAATGIESTCGLFVADSISDWSMQLNRLQNAELRNQAGREARMDLERLYSWDARLAPMLDLLQIPA